MGERREVCECGDSFTAQALCWVCVADLRATLAATEARLGEAEKRADAAVAIAREWDADFQRFATEGCNVAAVKDRRAALATLTGEG